LQVFCNPSILVPQWSTDLTPIDNLFFLTQGSFQWPDLCQLAMPSVEQRFNKNPPKPRLLLYNENELVKRREKYIIESDGYYKDRGVLSLLASTQLKKILERRVSPFGDSLSTTG
jgi:hypothetical protein